MKNIPLLCISIIFFSGSSFSQSLSFCETTDGSGNPVNANNVFTVAKNGGSITLVFTPAPSSGLTSVNFDLYTITNGTEVFQSSMKQTLSPSQRSVAKQVTFYNDGRYRIYVFDDQDRQLARSELLIKK